MFVYLNPFPSVISKATCPLVSCLLFHLHAESIFRSCRLLLCSCRCCLPSGLGKEFLRALGLLHAVRAQPFAIFAVRSRAEFAPTCLLVKDESPPHRVVSASRVCLGIERALVKL
eukprot:4182146-Pleurochrysis_carterae.AAC.1